MKAGLPLLASFYNVTYSGSMALSDRIFHPFRIAVTKRRWGAGESEYEMDGYEPEGFLDETDPEFARLIECINTHLAVEFQRNPGSSAKFWEKGLDSGLIDEIARVVLAEISSSRKETLWYVDPIRAHMGASPSQLEEQSCLFLRGIGLLLM